MAATALHLPPELWRLILKDFNMFTPDTLPSVSLTCRYLHSIAQTFIFRRLFLSYIHRSNNLSRKIARLAFYASDTIAPLVLNLSIFLGYRVPSPDATEITTLFFNALPRFLNIQSLRCYRINFTQLRLQQISAFSLEKFSVKESTLPLHTGLLSTLRPRAFTYRNQTARIGTDRQATHRWLALLKTNYLQELDIILTPDACAFFLASDDLSLLPFPSLHNLKCCSDLETLPHLPQLLSKTPALRYLKISLRHANPAEYIHIMESFGSTLPCSVPYLEKYNGPHELLPLVLGRAVKSPLANLRRLVLESDWDESLDAFLNTLKSCHPLQLKNLTHLDISQLISADLKSLTILQDTFPALQELHIHSTKYYNPGFFMYNVQLSDLYTLLLPPSIVSLSIQWTSRIPDSDTADVPSLVAAKNSLVLRLPLLRRLWLCDLREMALLWNRTASGKEERCSLHDVGPKDRIAAAWQIRAAVFPEEPYYV